MDLTYDGYNPFCAPLTPPKSQKNAVSRDLPHGKAVLIVAVLVTSALWCVV
jgi:hypothetical protein